MLYHNQFDKYVIRSYACPIPGSMLPGEAGSTSGLNGHGSGGGTRCRERRGSPGFVGNGGVRLFAPSLWRDVCTVSSTNSYNGAGARLGQVAALPAHPT